MAVAGQTARRGCLLHQVERDGGDQHARAEGHHGGHHVLPDPHEPGDERAEDQGGPAEQPPQSRFQPDRHRTVPFVV